MKIPTVLLASIIPLVPCQLPAQTFDDDRLTVTLSAFRADSRISVGASGRAGATDLPFSTSWSGKESIQDDSTEAHLQARLRLTDRQRLLGAHYDIRQSRQYLFSETLTAGEFPGEQVGLTGQGDFRLDFELANLMYEYAVVDTEQWLVGLSAGIHWARLEARAEGSATGGFADEGQAGTVDLDWVRRRWAPSVGVRVAYAPSQRWLLGIDMQGFATQWGNFTSEDGHYERVGLSAEYRLSRGFGLHAGYDWFLLDLRDDIRGSLAGDTVSFTGRAQGKLRVHGPVVGVSFSF